MRVAVRPVRRAFGVRLARQRLRLASQARLLRQRVRQRAICALRANFRAVQAAWRASTVRHTMFASKGRAHRSRVQEARTRTHCWALQAWTPASRALLAIGALVASLSGASRGDTTTQRVRTSSRHASSARRTRRPWQRARRASPAAYASKVTLMRRRWAFSASRARWGWTARLLVRQWTDCPCVAAISASCAPRATCCAVQTPRPTAPQIRVCAPAARLDAAGATTLTRRACPG